MKWNGFSGSFSIFKPFKDSRSEKMESRRSFRILVVDDDPALRRLTSDALQGVGYEVETACDGVEALGKLDLLAYDLVISDVEMPKLGGVEFYKRVIENFGYLRERFIFITGNLSSPFLSTITGMNIKWFSKPYRLSDLVECADRLIGVDAYHEDNVPKRRESRVNWQEDCFITEDVLNIPIYSQTLDISENGLKIKFRGKPFLPESVLRVFISNPGISVQGKIRWSKALSNTESLAGLELTEPLPRSSIIAVTGCQA